MRLGLFIVANLLIGSLAAGETITLTNGDVVSGAVVEQSAEMIVLDHPLLGRLQIPMSQVATVTASQEEASEGAAAVEAVAAKVAPIEEAAEAAPAEQAATVDEAGQAAPGEQTAEEAVLAAQTPAVEIAPVKPGLLGTNFLEGWSRHLEFGFSGSSGNSVDNNIHAALNAKFENERKRWDFTSSYFLASNDSERTTNQFSTQLVRDWLIPESPWFYFMQGRYDFDEFQSWEQRAGAFGGVGYTFIKTERLEVNGRLGAGATKDFGGEQELRPEGLIAGSVVAWKITDRQTLSAGTTVYPNLAEFGQYRIESNAEWTVSIDKADGLSLKFGLQNEYESDPGEDSKNNDLKYYGALVFDF